MTPQTPVRSTQGDRILFRIPRTKLRPTGLRRLERLERYNNYKIELLAEAKKKKFTLPASGLHITFYFPCPKTWSKKKKALHHGMLMQSRPDIDNLIKGFFDSLVSEDKYVASISACKRWADFPSGWIELSQIEEPFQTLVLPPAKE